MTGLNQEKIDEIRAAIREAVDAVFERYYGEFEGECEEAFIQYVENEFDLELPRDEDPEEIPPSPANNPDS